MEHNHSVCCNHEKVKYCEKCMVVYCEDCGHEWHEKCTLGHYYPYQWTYTSPTYIPSTTTTYSGTTYTCKH